MDKTAPRGEPPPLDPARHGLFLDYDGTLVAIAPTPDEAVADDALPPATGAGSSGDLTVLWRS